MFFERFILKKNGRIEEVEQESRKNSWKNGIDQNKKNSLLPYEYRESFLRN